MTVSLKSPMWHLYRRKNIRRSYERFGRKVFSTASSTTGRSSSSCFSAAAGTSAHARVEFNMLVISAPVRPRSVSTSSRAALQEHERLWRIPRDAVFSIMATDYYAAGEEPPVTPSQTDSPPAARPGCGHRNADEAPSPFFFESNPSGKPVRARGARFAGLIVVARAATTSANDADSGRP